MSQHNKLSKEEKTQIVLTVLRGEKTVSEIASEYKVHPNLITRWKQTALEGLPDLFEDKRKQIDRARFQEQEKLLDQACKLVGQRDIELDWLKKKLRVDDDYRKAGPGRPRKLRD